MIYSKTNIDRLAQLITASGFFGLTCFVQNAASTGPGDEARRLVALGEKPGAFLSLIEEGENLIAAGLARLLDWDTGFFGFPCAAIESLSAVGQGQSRVDALARVVSSLVQWCRQKQVKFIVAKVPGPDPLICQALEANNFYLTDSGVTLARDPGQAALKPEALPPDLSLAGQAGPPAETARIFRSIFFDGRFHNDARIPMETADRLWESAIHEQLRGKASHVLFLMKEGQPIGLATIMDSAGGFDPAKPVGRIFIFALLSPYRGRGLGKILLAELIARIEAQYQRLEVGTSTFNTPAIKVYQSLGFYLQGFHAGLHCWLQDS